MKSMSLVVLLLLGPLASSSGDEGKVCDAVPSAADLMESGTGLEAVHVRALEILQACPESAEAYELLGDSLRLRGELGPAEEALRRAAALAPSAAGPLVKLALVARERGEPEEAEILGEAALALASDAAEEEALQDLLEPKVSTKEEYAFKDADALANGLLVGAKSIRPKAISPDYRSDYFIGSKGLGVNLNILFEVGTSTLLPEGVTQLNELGKALDGAAPGEQYLIEGHSSSEGEAGFNMSLSEARARTVAEVLSAKFGVSAGLIETVGRGTQFPVMEDGVENRHKSRRVTILRLFDE